MRRNLEQKFIIVAPTHNLKNQIYVDARNSGIMDIFNTPDIKEYRISYEIMEQVECYYKIGAGMKIILFLKKSEVKQKKLSKDLRKGIRQSDDSLLSTLQRKFTTVKVSSMTDYL